MERYHITDDAHVYFVTYSIIDWLPVFVSDSTYRIVTDSLSYCHRQKKLDRCGVRRPAHNYRYLWRRSGLNLGQGSVLRTSGAVRPARRAWRVP